MRTFSDRC
jgi:Rab GDP dissociation inhibitor